jgi:hypothetical protein
MEEFTSQPSSVLLVENLFSSALCQIDISPRLALPNHRDYHLINANSSAQLAAVA